MGQKGGHKRGGWKLDYKLRKTAARCHEITIWLCSTNAETTQNCGWCHEMAMTFFGPTDLGEVGPIDSLPFVRSFVRRSTLPSDVRPSVCYHLSSETNHGIFLIFCIKLAFFCIF